MLFKRSILAALAMSVGIWATETPAEPPADELPVLPAKLTTTFPDSDATLGLKLVNGHATLARVELSNLSEEPLNLAFIGARLTKTGEPEEIMKNFTLVRTAAVVGARSSEVVDYRFEADLNPQDVLLNIFAAVQDQAGKVYQVVAYNGTASIVEPPISLLDPQIIFLYLIIAGVLAGTGRFIYSTWIQSLLPVPAPKPRTAKPKKVIPAVVEPTSGDESAAASGFDDSWIPEMHKNKPVAKRVKGAKNKKAE